jgi:hypothetical protein
MSKFTDRVFSFLERMHEEQPKACVHDGLQLHKTNCWQTISIHSRWSGNLFPRIRSRDASNLHQSKLLQIWVSFFPFQNMNEISTVFKICCLFEIKWNLSWKRFCRSSFANVGKLGMEERITQTLVFTLQRLVAYRRKAIRRFDTIEKLIERLLQHEVF